MDKSCIYARYSTDAQNATSIDDQVAHCRGLAARDGISIDDSRVFADRAITGRAEGLQKRTALRQMLDACDAGVIDTIYVDEVSRLSRDLADGADLVRRAERTGLRIVACDGADTRREGWQLLMAMRLVVSGEEVRYVSRWVARSMQGLLDRGQMIAAPPFGYRVATRNTGSEIHCAGAQWEIDENQSAVVRSMFEWRKSGLSAASIARKLNERAIPSPRRNRAGEPGYWRPASVHRLLRNAIYKGVFRYQGSDATRAKLAKRRQSPLVVEYPRAQFKIVDEALWDACNPRDLPKQIRGGTKHLFAGLVRCGDCGCTLSVGGGPHSRTLHCPQCEQAKRVGARASFIGYSTVSAARLALQHVLQALFQEPARAEFVSRLKARLTEPHDEEEVRLKAWCKELTIACERLVALARQPGIGMDFVASQLGRDTAELQRTELMLKAVSSKRNRAKPATVERQLAVNPADLIPLLFDSELPAYEVRAMLKRLLDRFVMTAKTAKFVTVFEVTLVPGAVVASMSKSELVDDTAKTFRVTVTTTARRPITWDVDVQCIA